MRGQTLYQFTNGKGSGDKCGVQPCQMQDFFCKSDTYVLASERSERDTLRSVQLRIADIYIIYYV